jgi:Rod binding domain-containing protein
MATSPVFSLANAQSAALESREDRMIQLAKSPGGAKDDAKIEKGAKEFEAILVGSWLQQAEQSFATLPGTDEDQDPGRDSMMSLGVETLSKSMAASGGIGIAKMIAKAMHAAADKASAQLTEPAGQTAAHENK